MGADETVKTARTNLRRLDTARDELLRNEQTFLRSRGWWNTSDTPGFSWMWARELHGVTILTSQRNAVETERAILYGDAPAVIAPRPPK